MLFEVVQARCHGPLGSRRHSVCFFTHLSRKNVLRKLKCLCFFFLTVFLFWFVWGFVLFLKNCYMFLWVIMCQCMSCVVRTLFGTHRSFVKNRCWMHRKDQRQQVARGSQCSLGTLADPNQEDFHGSRAGGLNVRRGTPKNFVSTITKKSQNKTQQKFQWIRQRKKPWKTRHIKRHLWSWLWGTTRNNVHQETLSAWLSTSDTREDIPKLQHILLSARLELTTTYHQISFWRD